MFMSFAASIRDFGHIDRRTVAMIKDCEADQWVRMG